MENHIPTPNVSEILLNEFLIPLNLSAFKLAKNIHVPTSRIQDILHGRRKISADTSVRLGRYFGVSDRYFLNIQSDIDIRRLLKEPGCDIDTIEKYEPGTDQAKILN